jgi:cellulose synthase/poly-beta-1,6-N-acetylglucosamine synthase-like glycosyltransferase
MKINEDFPNVSILIAVRNEEENILDLLHSLEKLTYPKEQLQILIGNDGSTDRTEEIIREFTLQTTHYQLFNIKNQVAGLKGKANVLAQLAHHAKGEYFFFTDADVKVPMRWIEEMPKINGIVTGITLVKNNNWFEACQAIEWFFALYLMKRMTDFKLPSTGMGNNMMVSAAAYWAVGGYEKIGFSIVEDYALYKAIVDAGFEFRQEFKPSLMTVTKPPPNYFEQRKRWVTGGIASKSILIVPAFIQGLALPILLIISFLSWKISLLIVLANLIFNFIFGNKIFKKVNQSRLLKYIPAYTMYMYVFWFLQLLAYFLPTKLVWKGRQY